MKGYSGYLRLILFVLICFVFQNINAQFSKTHYIPPIGTTGSRKYPNWKTDFDGWAFRLL